MYDEISFVSIATIITISLTSSPRLYNRFTPPCQLVDLCQLADSDLRAHSPHTPRQGTRHSLCQRMRVLYC